MGLHCALVYISVSLSSESTVSKVSATGDIHCWARICIWVPPYLHLNSTIYSMYGWFLGKLSGHNGLISVMMTFRIIQCKRCFHVKKSEFKAICISKLSWKPGRQGFWIISCWLEMTDIWVYYFFLLCFLLEKTILLVFQIFFSTDGDSMLVQG